VRSFPPAVPVSTRRQLSRTPGEAALGLVDTDDGWRVATLDRETGADLDHPKAYRPAQMTTTNRLSESSGRRLDRSGSHRLSLRRCSRIAHRGYVIMRKWTTRNTTFALLKLHLKTPTAASCLGAAAVPSLSQADGPALRLTRGWTVNVDPCLNVCGTPDLYEIRAAPWGIAQVYKLPQRHGVSQRGIAASTGQSRLEMSEILAGRRVNAYDVLIRIADGLSVPRGWLAGSSI
jgi:hypothetical protein